MKHSKHIKDHTTSYGKNLARDTNKKFGISPTLIIRAVNGDEKALTEISDKGRLGERFKLAMPAIKEHLKAYIEGTKEYNLALAEIYKSGGAASRDIDRAAGDLSLENQKHLNLIEEYKARLFKSLEKEGNRHQDEMGLIELRAWIDAQMVDVEVRAKFESESNKPMLKQMEADRAYEDAKIQHILTNGSDSDLSLIPKKHFSTNPVVKVWNSVRSMFS